jgi:drug/metabolite transporter (DMT)-like permease
VSAAPGHAGQAARVIAAAALFSTAGTAIKATTLTSWQVAGLRAGFATIAVLFLLPETRRRFSPRAALVGLVYAATVILFAQANKLTTAANAIFIQSTSPLYILLLGPWLLGERAKRSDLYFLVAIVAGVALFFIGLDAPSATAPNPLLGNLLAVLSGAACGLLMIGLRWLAREEHAGSASAVFLGNLFAFLICLWPMLPVTDARLQDVVVVGYLGVFQIGLAYAFLTRAMVHLPALEAALLLFVEPVLSPFWAFLVHGEMPGAWSLVGCALILGATLVRTIKETA